MPQKIRRIAIIIGLSMILVSLLFKSYLITLSIAVGATLSIISFESLSFVVTRALDSSSGSRGVIIFLAIFKFILLGIILWLLIMKADIHPLAFLIGLMTIMIAIVTMQVFKKINL